MSAGGTGVRLGFAADVWSLAATIVYVFTETAPYSGQNVWQIITALTAERVPPAIPESVPAALRELLSRCFAFESEARPEIHEIVQQLQVRRDSVLLRSISHVYFISPLSLALHNMTHDLSMFTVLYIGHEQCRDSGIHSLLGGQGILYSQRLAPQAGLYCR